LSGQSPPKEKLVPSSARPSRSSALVVLLALVLASAGLAGTAYGASLTTKQVKKIAAKVVKNKAPKLSVKHAATADLATTATTATTAGTAGSAGTAGNATNLNGLPASTYLDRVSSTSSIASTAINGANVQILGPEGISVPAGIGYVLVTASSSFTGGNNNVAIWVQVDAPCIALGSDFDNRQLDHTGNGQTSVTITRVLPLSPGNHTFRLCAGTGAAMNADNRFLAVQTVAFAGD
jgi:hypothetical protein